MILTVGNTKGGVGKSTLAVNIAITRALQGRDVWLVDGDKQGSSQTAIYIRSEAGIEPGIACSFYPDGPVLRSQVLQQRDKFDDIIIECGGRDSTALRAALTLTDILLVPFIPGSFEVWAMEHVSELIKEARSVRDNLVAYSILNKADTNPRTKDNIEVVDAIREFSEVQLIENYIYQRKAYANAAGSGRCVKELKLRKAEKVAIDELDKIISILFND